MNIMFTEIIPFYFVLDKKIIKIFTLNFLDHNIRNDNEQLIEITQSPDASVPSSLNNSVDLGAENDDPNCDTDIGRLLNPALQLSLDNMNHT